jgi:hypothetical protein
MLLPELRVEDRERSDVAAFCLRERLSEPFEDLRLMREFGKSRVDLGREDDGFTLAMAKAPEQQYRMELNASASA